MDKSTVAFKPFRMQSKAEVRRMRRVVTTFIAEGNLPAAWAAFHMAGELIAERLGRVSGNRLLMQLARAEASRAFKDAHSKVLPAELREY